MMPDFEKEILEHVRQHPGCSRAELMNIVGHPNVGNEADYMVRDGKLDRWYTGTVPAYYIPGTHTPHHLRDSEMQERDSLFAAELAAQGDAPVRDFDEVMAEFEQDPEGGIIPLAAGLHRDGTIHIYVKEKDSGLSVGLLEDGTLIVKVDESMRTMVAGKAR